MGRAYIIFEHTPSYSIFTKFFLLQNPNYSTNSRDFRISSWFKHTNRSQPNLAWQASQVGPFPGFCLQLKFPSQFVLSFDISYIFLLKFSYMIMHWLLLLHHSLDGAILPWDHQKVISICVHMNLSGICDYFSIDLDLVKEKCLWCYCVLPVLRVNILKLQIP